MSQSAAKMNSPSETPSAGCQNNKQQQNEARSVVTKIEVVNEIQSVGEKKTCPNLPTMPATPTSSGGDNNSRSEVKKCLSSRNNSKTNLTAVTTPSTLETATTTTTTLKTAKRVTIQSSRRTSREKERTESSTTNVCGKLLKRVKNMLEKKDIKSANEEEDIVLPVRYYPESLSALCKATRFSEDEIKRMYRSFKAQCPTGFICEDTFKDIYSQFFPFGVSTAQYAHYVFNAIDRDSNGSVSFEEFVFNLSILSRGSLDEKLEWTFSLYDVNGDGHITRDEMTEVMTSVYELMGKVSEGCKEENQIKEKVENMFKKMDLNADNKISLDEFLLSCHKDDGLMESIAVFQTIF